MRILAARNCAYEDANQTAINCWIDTDTGLVDVPFTASMYDMEAHGRELFLALQVNGLADWQAPRCMEELL